MGPRHGSCAAFAFALALALALGASAAGAATLGGVIVDAAGQPLGFANVSVASAHTGAVADERGRFQLDLPPGRYEVVFSQIGYLGVKRTLEAGSL